MKAQRFSRFLVLSLVIVLLAGSTIVLARGLRQNGGDVDQLVLQRDEFPNEAEAYHTEQLTSESFPGDNPLLNPLAEGKGFRGGRIVGAWYPLPDSQDQGDASGDTRYYGAYVLNVAAQYENEACATAALKQIQESIQEFPVDITVDVIKDYDQPTVVTDDSGKEYVIRLTYLEEGETWETYWSFSVRDNILMALMVDGYPGPANREIFDTVTNLLRQR